MGVRQLEEFLGQADQKGFWIFSYANLGGAFFGAFTGNALLERTVPSLKLLGIALGVLLGVMITWKVKGYPVYKWILSYVMFLFRRYLKVGLGDPAIDANLYYRSRTIKQEPFMLVTTRDGKSVPVLVHRGSGTGSPADLLDGLVVPRVPNDPAVPLASTPKEKVWGILGGTPSVTDNNSGLAIGAHTQNGPPSPSGDPTSRSTPDVYADPTYGG